MFQGIGLGSPQLNVLITNQVVHMQESYNTCILTNKKYICMEQQEIVKEQCNKARHKINAKDP